MTDKIEAKFVTEKRIDADGTTEWFIKDTNLRHREDGPAVIRQNGDEIYWHNNKIHRMEGPAISLKNGYKAWLIDGKTHREDGPAIITEDGRETFCLEGNTYYRNVDFLKRLKKVNTERLLQSSKQKDQIISLENKIKDLKERPTVESSIREVGLDGGTAFYLKDTNQLHNENGPAIKQIKPDGVYEEYYLYGKRHRMGAPAISTPTKTEYYVNGLLHRAGDPACIISGPSGVITKVWYINGLAHRTNGPAWIKESKNGRYEQWYVNGSLHREGGPAVIMASGNYGYYKHGKLHRLDGPAQIDITSGNRFYIEGTRYDEADYWNCVAKITGTEPVKTILTPGYKETVSRLTGLNHSIGDEPSIVWTNGAKEYYKHGKLHRINGPAVIKGTYKIWYLNGFRHRSGSLPAVESEFVEEYWINGLLHNLDGPAVYDKKTKRSEYYVNGCLHRVGYPALVDPKHQLEEWWQNGYLHRVGGPAVIHKSRWKEWYQNGLRHRLDGPAYECGSDIEWYIEGKRYADKGSFEIALEGYYNKRSEKRLNLNSVKKIVKKTSKIEKVIKVKASEKAGNNVGWGTAVAAIAGAAIIKGLSKSGVPEITQMIAEQEKLEIDVSSK